MGVLELTVKRTRLVLLDCTPGGTPAHTRAFYSENARVCAKWQWDARDCVKLGLYFLRPLADAESTLSADTARQQQACSSASHAVHKSINRPAYIRPCVAVAEQCVGSRWPWGAFLIGWNASVSLRWPWKFNMVELCRRLRPLTSAYVSLRWTTFAPEV